MPCWNIWYIGWINSVYRVCCGEIRGHYGSDGVGLYGALPNGYLWRYHGAICLYELRGGALREHYGADDIGVYGSLCGRNLVGSGGIGL